MTEVNFNEPGKASPLHQAPHLLAMLSVANEARRVRIVERLRYVAIRHMGSHARGIADDDHDRLIPAALAVEASSVARPAIKAAARLLRACVRKLETPESISDSMLVVLYAALDAPAVVRDAVAQVKRAEGGRSKGSKLPSPAELRAEIEHLRATRGISEIDAKGVVRRRYCATSQAINRKLKKT